MKRLLASLAAVALLAGCATTGPPASPAAVVEQAATTAAKTLYVAEAGFDAASIAATQAAQSGALKGGAALAVLDALDRAHAALQVARAAYLLGDSVTTVAQANIAAAAVTQARGKLKGPSQ